jgi:hypothetical protein
VTYQTQYRHKEAGAQGAAVPALQPEYGSARQRGQVTKVAIGAPILLPLPERESRGGLQLSPVSFQFLVLKAVILSEDAFAMANASESKDSYSRTKHA